MREGRDVEDPDKSREAFSGRLCEELQVLGPLIESLQLGLEEVAEVEDKVDGTDTAMEVDREEAVV